MMAEPTSAGAGRRGRVPRSRHLAVSRDWGDNETPAEIADVARKGAASIAVPGLEEWPVEKPGTLDSPLKNQKTFGSRRC